EPSWVARHDRREQGGPRLDLVPDRDATARNTPGDRGPDGGPCVVELSGFQCRLRRMECGGCCTDVRLIGLQLFLANCMRCFEVCRPRLDRDGGLAWRLGAFHRRSGLVESGALGL